jgi:hypothetical protein
MLVIAEKPLTWPENDLKALALRPPHNFRRFDEAGFFKGVEMGL